MKKIICNMCGKEFDEWDEQEDFSIERRAGYGTFFDGFHIRLDLCCSCMEDIVRHCIITPLADSKGGVPVRPEECAEEDGE